jgi:hypothetical protein
MRRLLAGAMALSLVLVVAPATAAVKCGTERWPIKTLSDKNASKVDFNATKTTVKHLRSLNRPDVHLDSPRLKPVEYHTYKVRAALIETAHEDDRDYHLVIASPAHHHKTMIVEFPDTHCKGAASSIKKRAMKRARSKFENACGPISSSFKTLHGVAVIKGVGFWDFDHGQNGVAPNAIELHPVLNFHMVKGSC